MPRHTLRPNSDTVQAAAHPLRPHPVDNEYFTAGYVYETHDFLMAAAHFPLGVTVPPKFDPQADPDFRVAGTNVPTAFTGFPEVSKEFYILKAQLAHHIQKNLTASVLCWKQKYDNIDWQTQTEPYMGKVDPGSNRWFFLGAQVPSYDANILRAALTYTF